MEKFLMIAGHGGAPYDPGATGNGYEEANLTRDLAERIVQSSRTAGLDITLFDTSQNMVQVYRNGGTFPFQKYDMCLEIHFNASALESSVKDGKKERHHVLYAFVHVERDGRNGAKDSGCDDSSGKCPGLGWTRTIHGPVCGGTFGTEPKLFVGLRTSASGSGIYQ